MKKKKWRTPKILYKREAPTQPLDPEPDLPEYPPFKPQPLKFLSKMFWRFLGVKDDDK